MSDVLLGLYAHRAELQRLISNVSERGVEDDDVASDDRSEQLAALQRRVINIDMQIDVYLRSGTEWARNL